mgnify:CR=1 FL=1
MAYAWGRRRVCGVGGWVLKPNNIGPNSQGVGEGGVCACLSPMCICLRVPLFTSFQVLHLPPRPAPIRLPLRSHPPQVCRSLVRYLKGHGSDYAFDAATWAHYQRTGLSKSELFKVLRPFHEDDTKMQVRAGGRACVLCLCVCVCTKKARGDVW